MNFNQTLRNSIASAVNTPADPRISGAILQEQLLSVVNALDTGAKYMGVATHSTVPTTEANCFFLTSQEGTYTNFTDTGGKAIVVNQGELAVIRSIIYQDNLRWQKATLFTGGGGSAQLAVSITYAALKALRDGGNLVPGTWYRITDYHTTVSPIITNARSADHQFDVIVRADDASHLNENGYAAHHEGDEYFAACKLEAWTLQYRLENEKWSKVAGTFIEEDGDSYHLRKLGTVEVDGTTYVLWDASELTEDYEIVQAVSEDEEVGTELKGYDPETGEILDEGWTSSIASKAEVEADGQGTILMLKDEYGNQCPYDFKSIQFKRWAVTDSQQERQGLNGNYMGVLNYVPQNLSIEDETDFIWAYTFSSDATGSEDQVDFSLDGTHNVYGNVLEMAPNAINGLNDVVFYGEYNYSNHLCFDCYCNTFGNNCYRNSFGNGCNQNSFGN